MRPLDDMRILAVEQYGAGPWGSLQLADLGAEVIKVEDPATGGDVGRTIPPHRTDGDSLFFQSFNRNKRSIAIDLTSSGGRAVFDDLVKVSDAVFSNLRGDVPERLGLTYAHLGDINPAIVCCSLSAFGMTGPRRSEPGYDYIIQGLAGWMSLTGEPDGPPVKTGLSLVDYSGGYVAAISLLAGVHSARRTGIGMDCDVSLFDTAISLLTYVGTWSMSRDFEPWRTRHSAHPSIFPFQVFQTADGWLTVACAKEKFWRRFVEALELTDVAEDPRYGDFAGRMEHSEELTRIIDATLIEQSTDHWLALLQELGVPCGPVNDVSTALADPHVAARDLIVELEHPEFGAIKTPRTAVRVGNDPVDIESGPALDDDREAILTEILGYSLDRVETLTATGAFGGSR